MTRLDRVQTGGEFGILRGYAGGIPTFVPIVIRAGGRPKLLVVIFPGGVVVAERDQGGRSDRHGVGAEREGLGHVGA